MQTKQKPRRHKDTKTLHTFSWCLGVLVVILCFVPSLQAQTVKRVYLVPAVGTGATPEDARRPKYFGDRTDISFSAMDYGLEPTYLVVADINQAQHAEITANPDVLAAPADLDARLSTGAVATLANVFEARNIPAGWLDTTYTYREVLRIVSNFFQFAQRVHGTGAGRLFPTGVHLNTTLGEMTQSRRDALGSAAQSMGLSTAGMAGSTTLREMLKMLSDQFGARPVIVGGIEL